MKKIISFSLWGIDPKYCMGALKNAELAKFIYPDWVCRFYVGTSTPDSIVEKLSQFDNCEIIKMSSSGDWTGMFWRFLAADSDDIVISRDTDSRLNHREKDAVDDWLKSDKDFHIMRDHPYHGTEILGGMWGSRNGILKGIRSSIETYEKGNFWQVDQNFLRDNVYPIIKDNAKVHDEFFSNCPFPTRRTNSYFVGMAFDENDLPLHPKHMELIK